MKQALIDYLQTEQEVRRIVVFGAFLNSNEPQDMDVAAFQDGVEDYLPLALKYRRKTRAIAQRIALDILPLKMDSESDPFLAEVERGKSSMNDETRLWLSYVEENLESAELLLAHQLWNPCLQNAQQALENFSRRC